MTGIYFIAAGSSSKNREKSLDQALEREKVETLLPPEVARQLVAAFDIGPSVYAWGANKLGDLEKLDDGDFVVDVKNKKVRQIFEFAFFFKTTTTKLQEWIGWDAEKTPEERRLYPYVYFLRNPKQTARREKDFFAQAFGMANNQNWLVGQRRFNESEVQKAMQKESSTTIESFLGITRCTEESSRKPAVQHSNSSPNNNLPHGCEKYDRTVESKSDEPNVSIPWLKPVIEQVAQLKERPRSLERDHEDAVAHFFQLLGYQRGSEITFQHGRVDILIELQGWERFPPLVVEVKRSWALSKDSKKYIHQAHRYALEQGARFVILTNADRFLVYDRELGLDLSEQFIGEFQLTNVTESGLALIEHLKRSNLEKEMRNDARNTPINPPLKKPTGKAKEKLSTLSRLTAWLGSLLHN